MTTNLSFQTLVVLALALGVICGPGGHVSLLLRSFSNPSNRLINGDCCDPACSDCNYYFSFCIRDNPRSGNCLRSGTTKTYHNYKHLVFAYGQDLGNGWKNPLSGTFTSWRGLLNFTIDVFDYDYFSDADVVDHFNFEKAVLSPTPWLDLPAWRKISLGGGGHPSTLELKYNVQCNVNYYGPNCTTHCVPQDDDIAGHFTCDKDTGHLVCRIGWHGDRCKVYCVPYDDDTHGHYTCESGSGRKTCLPGWYGSSCKVHCAARNDSMAGYICDSQGKKLCLQHWYGKNKCDVYCKQNNDSSAGYHCNTMGRRVCLQGWYGPQCDCRPRNDSYMGYLCNTTTGQKKCLKGWFGGNCDVFCRPRNDSAGHYVCRNQTGAKECLPHWFGDNCTVYCVSRNDSLRQHQCSINGSPLCSRNWYGPSCSVYCASRNDEVGHYTCHPVTGQKICKQDWYGNNCSTFCVPRDSDWYGHYNCSMVDGSKQCHGNWYGTYCKTFCAARNGSLGHYTCDPVNGSKTCLNNWFGTDCNTYCKAMNNSHGHYRCNVRDGRKICHKGWYGSNCTVHCAARNDSIGHYKCDASDGSKICQRNWYGTNCSTHCVPEQCNVTGHYTCNVLDGTRICHQNWYGPNCTVHCLKRNDSQGHYECNAVNGGLSCHYNWHGTQCTVFCSPTNSSEGHYTCDPTTGARICLPGWKGNYCDEETSPVTEHSSSSTLEPTSWTLPTFPTDSDDNDKVAVELCFKHKGHKTPNDVIGILKQLLADKLTSFCEMRLRECGLSDAWLSVNRTFETGDVMLSAREVSNKSVFVEVAVKLPSDVKGQPGGSIPGGVLKEVILTNQEYIENTTSTEVRHVRVITPSRQPGLSGSAVSKSSPANTSSWLLYIIPVSGLSVFFGVVIIASWNIRKIRRRQSRVHVIKVAPADGDWSLADNVTLLTTNSTATNKEKQDNSISRCSSSSDTLPCSAV